MSTINPLLNAYSPAAAPRSSGASVLSGPVEPATPGAAVASAIAPPAQPLQAASQNASAAGMRELEPESRREANEDLQRQLDDVMKDVQTSLRFRVDDDSNRVVVSVIDQESGDVIQQIPSEVSLKIAQRMAELGSGMINESA